MFVFVSVVFCVWRADHSSICASGNVGGLETSKLRRRSPELRLGSAWKNVFSLEDSWSKFINSYKECCIRYFLLCRFFFLLLQNSTLLSNNLTLSVAATNSHTTRRTRITAPTASSQPHFISSDCEWRRWLPDMKCTWKKSKSHIQSKEVFKGGTRECSGVFNMHGDIYSIENISEIVWDELKSCNGRHVHR